MLTTRWAEVTAATRPHPGLTEVTVSLDGAHAPAIAYDALTGSPVPGDRVLLNTSAVGLGLGTGGVHLVMAIDEAERPGPPAGHAVKLRYTPVQIPVDAVEDSHRVAIDEADLTGVPVVIAPLHSLIAPVALGIRSQGEGVRAVYVMTDAAALALPFSRSVPALVEHGLLASTITAGQAFGGDLEAVTLFSALAAARAVARADVIVVSMGPGNLGTGSRLGTAAMEVGVAVNAAAALGARPIVVPRISFADERSRHRGLSHHTATALTVAALAPAELVLPPLDDEQARAVEERLGPLRSRHQVVEVDGDMAAVVAGSPLPLRSMGRRPEDDPVFFWAGVAAGIHAARCAHA